MKIAIEKHSYAPELNKVMILRGKRVVSSFPAAGVTTIKEARQKFFAPVQTGRTVKISTEYPAPYKSLDRVYRGRVSGFNDVIRFRDQLREKCSGGALLNGDFLPAAKIIIESRLIG